MPSDSATIVLFEEIGKFGTKTGLNDLVKKYGDSVATQHTQALVMSIARFAIRNISSTEGVQFLLKLISLEGQVDWHIVYALQRIGDHPEIRNHLDELIPLSMSKDPLVRMNLAALFGKFKNENRCIDPLIRLAETDTDWCVRVNAVKALGNYDLQNYPKVVDLFCRLFDDKNQYVALTAVLTFGNCHFFNTKADISFKQAKFLIAAIAGNHEGIFSWQLQSEATLARAKLFGASVVSMIQLENIQSRSLHMRVLNALGYTGSSEAVGPLLNGVNGKDVVLARAALEGLQELATKIDHDSIALEKIYEAGIHALQSDDVALITTAASILGDSLFLHPSSVPALLEALYKSRVPG